MMKKIVKQIIGICMLLALLVSTIPEDAQAGTSRITLVYGTTDNARAGDNVSVRIVVQDNPTISTFAVAVGYDPNYLSYTSTTFSSNANNGSNIGMASDVAGDNNRRTVNVSCILGQNYQANEVIATVNFTVRQAYTTMPVTPSAREITDANYRPITVSERIENGAGQPSQSGSGSQSGSQTQPSQSQSGSQTQPSQSQSGSQTSQTNQPSQTGDSQSQNPSGSQTSQNPSQSGSQPSQTPSGSQPSQNPPSGGSSSTSGKKDATPKTGAFSLRFAFGGAVVLFLAVSMVCIKVLGKKKHI